MKKAERGVVPLTNTMHKQLGLGREVVIDDVVKLWNVNTTSCQVCDDHDLDLLLLELGHMDFASCLVQGTVDVGTANSTLGQQLWKNKTKKKDGPMKLPCQVWSQTPYHASAHNLIHRVYTDFE